MGQWRKQTSSRWSVQMLLAALAWTITPFPTHAKGGATEVDVELVLAVDISYSMDIEEQKLQREGYIKALTSAEVLKAIRSGLTGRIAITYFEWAGANTQRVIVPWQILDGPETADAFVAKLNATPISRWSRTSVSGAILFGQELFENNGFDSARRVLDISGDGPNNSGSLVEDARDRAVKSGIVINGLPIMLNNGRRSAFDMDDLDDYYTDCVIGGPGSFMVAIKEREQFVEATRIKILREIASIPNDSTMPDDITLPTGLRIMRANSEQDPPRKKIDCRFGERQWQERYRN